MIDKLISMYEHLSPTERLQFVRLEMQNGKRSKPLPSRFRCHVWTCMTAELCILRFLLPRHLFSCPKRRLSLIQKRLSACYAGVLLLHDPDSPILKLILSYFLERSKRDTPYASMAFRDGHYDLLLFLIRIHDYTERRNISVSLKK